MLERMLTYERDWFLSLNGSDYYFLDCLMWLFSSTFIWVPLYLFVLIMLVYKKSWTYALSIVVVLTLLVVICDQFSSGLCKPLFTRLRPSHHPDFVNQVDLLYGYRSGKYGFISGHATNSFGFAVFTAMLLKNRAFTIVICLWACIVAYTRIYLGVHFISDILGGTLAGIMLALILYYLYRFYLKRFTWEKGIPHYPPGRGKTAAIVIVTYMILIAVFTTQLIPWFAK